MIFRLLFLLSTFFISGCCFLNGYIDQHKEFERIQNDHVGIALGYDITKYKVEMRDGEEVFVVPSYTGSNGCKFEYLVSRNTQRVVAWHYLSNDNECKTKRFYCGAW